MRRGAAFVAQDGRGGVLLEKRAENGLLGGMMQPPMTPWSEMFPSFEEASRCAPYPGKWKKLEGSVRHGFTHFELEIEVYAAVLTDQRAGLWIATGELDGIALPTAMRKILVHAGVCALHCADNVVE